MNPTPIIDTDKVSTLRRPKLGRLADTLTERLAMAKTNKLTHSEFLQILLSDEVTRRDATPRPRTAGAAARGSTPTMRLKHWDVTTEAAFDHKLWDQLCSLRFVENAVNVLIMGPVGVGKTFLATAFGHIAVRRRHSVRFERADRLHKRLRTARVDNSHDALAPQAPTRRPVDP